jgi:outer membrane protein OmpA-like peptidoglycan-associated protein
MRLRLLALSFAVICTPGVALAQGNTTPDQAQPTSPTLVAQAETRQFVVYFPLGEAALSAEASATIATAAQEYQRTGQAMISVRGHADTSGDPAFNQELSERREQAVTDELIRLGVPAEAITGEALGETDLAVQTPDGVPEAQNRRVEITVQQPPPPPEPAPAPAPAPEPAPPPVAAAPEPEPEPEEPRRGLFNVGPFYGYNLRDENRHGSHLAGLNFSFDYAVAPWVGVGVEQAVFYHFATQEDGFGGRSAGSLNFLLPFAEENAPYIGGNFGYLYGSGIEDDFFAGPEIGVVLGGFNAKVAYDIPFNRDLDKGIINATLGFGIRF